MPAFWALWRRTPSPRSPPQERVELPRAGLVGRWAEPSELGKRGPSPQPLRPHQRCEVTSGAKMVRP